MRQIRNIISLIYVEGLMEIKTRFKYGLASISDFVIFSLTFLAVMFFTNVSNMNSYYHTVEGTLLILIGYMLWNTGVVAMDIASQSIESDAKAGILESELQSKYPIWLLFLIRNFVSNLFIFIYLFVLSFVTIVISTKSIEGLLKVNLIVLAFSIIANIGMFGVGLIFGAGSLRYKRVGQWSTILQVGILLVSNVTVPYTSEFQMIIPFVGAIEMARNLYLGYGFDIILFLKLLSINLIWFFIGLVIFKNAIEKERKSGMFDVF